MSTSKSGFAGMQSFKFHHAVVLSWMFHFSASSHPTQHTTIAVTVLVEMFLVYHKYPSTSTAVLILFGFCTTYVVWWAATCGMRMQWECMYGCQHSVNVHPLWSVCITGRAGWKLRLVDACGDICVSGFPCTTSVCSYMTVVVVYSRLVCSLVHVFVWMYMYVCIHTWLKCATTDLSLTKISAYPYSTVSCQYHCLNVTFICMCDDLHVHILLVP